MEAGVLFLVVLLVIVGCVGLLVAGVRSKQKEEFEQEAAQNPLDPALEEVFSRHPYDHSWKTRGAADRVLRACSPHILRMTVERGEIPVLIVHTGPFGSVRSRGGLLVVTTGQTLLFAEGRVTSIGHRGTSTSISAGFDVMHADVTIAGDDGRITFTADGLEQARLICGAIDNWAENPQLRPDPRVLVTPRRAHLPDEFFSDVLHAAGHPVTPTNLRSLHERFGMMFINQARRTIDQAQGLAAGETFTQRYGRPAHDSELPGWAARVLQGWIELEPNIGHTVGPVLPHLVRCELLATAQSPGGYLAHPGPLSMWHNHLYEPDDAHGRRTEAGPPPVTA